MKYIINSKKYGRKVVLLKYNKRVLKRKHCKTLDEAKIWKKILIKQLGLEGVM